jgi:hypothetical protein
VRPSVFFLLVPLFIHYDHPASNASEDGSNSVSNSYSTAACYQQTDICGLWCLSSPPPLSTSEHL